MSKMVGRCDAHDQHSVPRKTSLAQEHTGDVRTTKEIDRGEKLPTGDTREHNLYRDTRVTCDVDHHGVQYFLSNVFDFLTVSVESSYSRIVLL
jgi:hypothetical protein